MRKIRIVLMWLWLLTKRLYKKPAFLILLVSVPLIVFGYSLSAQEESGMMTIVVAVEDSTDPFSQSLISELQESSNVIRFMQDDDPVKARQMVYDGVVDAAWIFPEDIEQQIYDFVAGTYTGQGFISVIVREETVSLMLTNEKLSGKLFVSCARNCFLQYFRQNAPEMDSLTDEQILAYFDGVTFDESLFSFSYVDSSVENENSMNYLLMPVRGILAVLIVIGGMATAMFYTTDDREGLFSWISLRNKPFVELGYQAISLTNITAVVLIALCAAGLSVGILRELLSAVLYILCCSVFCQLLRLWCGGVRVTAMVLPVLIIAMITVCPIFFSVPAMKYVQLLFPPTFYINAIYNYKYLLYMLVYSLIVKCLYEVSIRVFKRI